MVDTPNYANSPLANPNFLNPTPEPQASKYTNSVLANPQFLAEVAATEPTVQQRTLEEERRRLEQEAARLRNRSAGEILGDSLITAAATIPQFAGSLGSLAVSGVGNATQYFAEDGSLAEDIGGVMKDYAVVLAGATDEVTQGIVDTRSDVAQESARIQGEIGAIDSQISQRQYEEDIAAGDSEFIAGLTMFGRDVINAGDRVLSDPVATGDLLSNAAGSVLTGSILAKAGERLATGLAARYGIEGVQRLALQTAGSSVGMGLTEATSTYTSTVNEVMSRTPEEMVGSQMYQDLIAQGYTHQTALMEVADAAGLDAFVRQLPSAMAAGLLSAKFNANPLSVMRGENPLGVLATAGKEALEEAAQGGSGQLNQNLAIQRIVDPNQGLIEGVGDQVALGAIGGFGVAGAIGAPSGIANGLQEQADRIREEVAYDRFVQGMGDQIAAQRRADAREAMTPQEREADLRSTMTQTSPAEDLFNSVTGRVREAAQGLAERLPESGVLSSAVDTIKTGVQAAKAAAEPLVNKAIKTAQDYVERPNPVIQSETVAAAEEVSQAVRDPAVDTGSLGSATDTTPESVPEVFKDTVVPGSTIADTMTAIVKTLAEKKTPISDMADDAILYVTEKFNQMQGAAASLAPEIQEKVKKVLASPDLERIRKRAARLDLNTAISSTVEAISPKVKAMTIAMSKVNPTSVNPEIISRILKQDDRESLTPEIVRDLEIAQSVSIPMNSYKEGIVQIAEEKYKALKATGQNPEKPESNVEKVSRNLIVGNLSGENKVPSINDFANQIITGMRSPDQSVEIDGVRVPVKTIAENMGKLADHMTFKVNALNESFDKNDASGVGPRVMHDTLVRGKDFIKAGMAGSAAVNYNKRSVNSVTFAKTVAADAKVLIEVYNALAAAYPEAFPNGPKEVPVLKTVEATETAAKTATQEEQVTASETASVGDQNTNQNTTAVEEVPPAGGTDENGQNTQNQTQEQTPSTTETDEIDNKIIAYMNQRKVVGNKVRKLKARKPTPEELAKIQRRLEGMSSFVGMDVSTLVSRIYVFSIEEGFDFGGFAFESNKEEFGIEGSVIAFNENMFDMEQAGALDHLVAHEMGHVIDFAYSAALGLNGDTASFIPEFWAKGTSNYPNDGISREDPVEVKEDGAIYAEVRASMKKSDWFKRFFNYALSYDESIDVSMELFAELVAMHTVYGDAMAKDFPKFLSHYNKVMNAIGGRIEINQDNSQEDSPREGRSDTDSTEGSVSRDEVITNSQSAVKSTTENLSKPFTGSRFVSVFRPKKTAPKAQTAQEALDLISAQPKTEVYREFAEILIERIRDGMNKRLQTVTLNSNGGPVMAEALKANAEEVLEIQRAKTLMIVDPETGVYDQRLLDLASLVVIDWMTTARSYGADRLDDLMKELELKPGDVTKEEAYRLMSSLPPRSTSEQLARKVMKLWNVNPNRQSQMVDIRGATEGLVKEIITVLSLMEDPLVQVVKITVGKGEAFSFDISNLAPEQEAIGVEAAGSLDNILFPEERIMASFGEPLTHVDSTQSNKPDVKLSSLERKALKKMQDTAHIPSEPVIGFFKALGLDSWSRMAGKKDSSQLAPRHPLHLSIEGKNTSIERDYLTAFQMADAAAGRPVFYPVGVTNVGRHQMKGLNPQNNKLLRAMITPTHSKLDMANNQKHKDAFWLTVAQSSGIAKVEKKLHSKILSTVQQDFEARFGEAAQLVSQYLETGSLDQEAFADAMLKANKGESVEVAQVNAVLAVARLQQALKAGKADTFETSLSFELDGKTDGPANMMMAFGQGLMTRLEYENFKRIGLFLGSKNETLNTLFSGGEVDLYEVNSTFSTKKMFNMINSAKGLDKKRLIALQRFAAHFGDFEIKPDGSIVMSRATSKNPMTKRVYGSGETGIADGITQDMLVGFYTQLVELPDGVSVEEHLNYPEINDDLDMLFGVRLPEKLDVNKFILPRDMMVPFAQLVKDTIGVVLSDSISEVMSEKTTDVNALLVYTTGVQGEFMRLFFEQRLAEVVEEARKEWEANNTSKFALRKLSQEAYDAVVKETMEFAPYFDDGLQALRIGDFTGQQDKTEMSANLSGKISVKSTMQRPDHMGVKAIPYVVQGRGDAMMMNRIFGADNAPQRAIPIFDGIDMAVSDFSDLAPQINEAVLANWDNDVIGPIVDNFSGFLEKVRSQGLENKLTMAFNNVKKASEERSPIVAVRVEDLETKLKEAHRLNQARKAVFKEITLSVDHMGGSGIAYVRNEDGKELTYEEINQLIQDKLDGKEVVVPVAQQEEPVQVQDPIVVTDVATMTLALMKQAKPYLRDVVRSIRGMLPDDARIVMGTEDQIAKWRAENSNPSSKTLEQRTKGFYDVDSNTIFIISDNHETITHELIHMATFKAVLDHYTGVQKSTAVKNLEVLMDEFLTLDSASFTEETMEAYLRTKAAIVVAKSEATPMGDSVALNEFMAWTLSNEHLMKELKQTPTSLVARLTKVAKAWIQKILGVVPLDMYSQILFNTEMIRNEEYPGGFETQEDEEVTPTFSTMTNFWIDRMRERLEQSKIATGKEANKQITKYMMTAEDALKKLDFGGFGLSEYQKTTFASIHVVIASELRLDSKALIALGKTYEHVVNNLTPAMLGDGQIGQDRYGAVMELMGATKNDEGVSDAIAVLLALSQTSTSFRKAMEQLPQPSVQRGQKVKSLNDLLTTSAGYLMQKMIASSDLEGKSVKEILDNLSDEILKQDNANEFKALQGLMKTFNKADKFVGGALSTLAQRTNAMNREVQASTRNGLLKTVSGAVTLATNYLDPNLSKQSAKAAKTATHMGGLLDGAVFIRELVSEIVGGDAINTDVIQMLDKVNYVVQSSRQAYREELPVIFQNAFKTHPNEEQWRDLHHVLGKSDFAALFDLKNPDDSFDMLSDQSLLDRRIAALEKKIRKEFPGVTGQDMIDKGKQLADFMNGKGAGFQLIKNAYAIHKLAGGNKPAMIKELDRLISLYALNGTDKAQRESVANMQASDPDGVHNLLVYVQALNKEEDSKVISEAARMNGYKGYIPDHSKGEIDLIIARDADREDLERRGYVRVADDTTDSGSLTSRGYYMTTVKQGGNYSQGVLQQVQDTYRGVNATTGLTVNGTTSGVISGIAVVSLTDALNNAGTVRDPKNVLIPVYDQDGGVLFYERAINPDLAQKYLQPPSNMAMMVGAWAGRQVEEKFSHEYNLALVTELKKIWDNREPNTDGLFERMDTSKDKIYQESWKVIPPQLKEHIIGVFGEETGFMVRKDMINLALGYRDPSIVDVWTGNHRLPESVALAVKTVGKMTMGDKAFKWLANTETVTMNTVSTAKDLIVVRSLVVPFMNTQSNVMQLVNRGVGTKAVMKGYRDKFVEIDKLNENLKKIMGLQAEIRLAATNKNKVAILKQQIQVLEDENKRFSVAPLVEAGAYKTISEGMTELDVSITDGKFGDWVEGQLNKLPAGVQTVVKYGLLSKDTAIYRGANKAVQYGDFIAKSIYYDHLIETGMSPERAMARVNEEFVNFSLLPGRTRTYLEGIGATWFLTFKIRSMKVALQTIRENPVRSMVGIGVLGLESGPVTDNLISKAAEGTLPYSLGWDMLWDAPGMNPWATLTTG